MRFLYLLSENAEKSTGRYSSDICKEGALVVIGDDYYKIL